MNTFKITLHYSDTAAPVVLMIEADDRLSAMFEADAIAREDGATGKVSCSEAIRVAR